MFIFNRCASGNCVVWIWLLNFYPVIKVWSDRMSSQRLGLKPDTAEKTAEKKFQGNDVVSLCIQMKISFNSLKLT